MMADSGIYDQATIARRQKIAEQMLADDSKPPNIRSWAQGLSHLGNIGADVFSLNQLDKKKAAADQSSRDAMMELLNGAGGDQVPGPAPSAAPASSPTMAPPSPSVVNASAAPRIYDQSERNPLDPPAGADRDMLIRAIHGEAGNQGPEGMRAVASVIRNRVEEHYGGHTTYVDVCQAKAQFSAWTEEAAAMGAEALLLAHPDPTLRLCAEIAHATIAGVLPDVTHGANHYYAVTIEPPSWAVDAFVLAQLGHHKFYNVA